MKLTHWITALAVSSSMVAAPTFAGTSSMSKKSDHDSSGNLSKITRLNESSLEFEATAKDLIGAEVYDSAGEKIGEITDFSVNPALPRELVRSLQSKRVKDGTGVSSMWNKDSKQASADMNLRDKEHQGDLAGVFGSDLAVFVSVGGMLGIGDDIVSVPASLLTFDAEEQRFVIDVAKSDIVAIAETEPTEEYENDTYSAKQRWSNDAHTVQQALLTDARLGSESSMITVSVKDNDTIELTGTVSAASFKDRAEKVAEEATDLDVKNSIKVQK